MPPASVRDRAIAAGITVNGLAIRTGAPGLHHYYADNVVGGTGSFVVSIEDYRDFSTAILEKLLREISGSPVAEGPSMPERATAHLDEFTRAPCAMRRVRASPWSSKGRCGARADARTPCSHSTPEILSGVAPCPS